MCDVPVKLKPLWVFQEPQRCLICFRHVCFEPTQLVIIFRIRPTLALVKTSTPRILAHSTAQIAPSLQLFDPDCLLCSTGLCSSWVVVALWPQHLQGAIETFFRTVWCWNIYGIHDYCCQWPTVHQRHKSSLYFCLVVFVNCLCCLRRCCRRCYSLLSPPQCTNTLSTLLSATNHSDE
jgi:hypothetical protein